MLFAVLAIAGAFLVLCRVAVTCCFFFACVSDRQRARALQEGFQAQTKQRVCLAVFTAPSKTDPQSRLA